MKYNPDVHHRHSIGLRGYDYSQAGLYFITICTQNRRVGKPRPYIFGEMRLNEMGQIVEIEWLKLTIKYPNIDLHEFIIMPNHFHAIIQIVTPFVGAGRPRPYVPTLGNMIAYFKYKTTKQIEYIGKLWQRNYHEHIIRNEKSHQNIAEYIINNPLIWENDRYNTN